MHTPFEADGLAYISLPQLLQLEQSARLLVHSSRMNVSSMFSGQHSAKERGRGLNFEELRHYLPGDDLRYIDWKISLRLGKPFIRSFTEERDRPALILLDQRMNMFFGSVHSLKSCIAAELAALLAWMIFHRGDRVGGLIFSDTEITKISPLRSRSRLNELFRAIVVKNNALYATAPDLDSQQQIDQTLQHALAIASHDHFICLISDFSEMSSKTLTLLRALSTRNQVLALQVYDPMALELPEDGRLLITQGQLQAELNLKKASIRYSIQKLSNERLEHTKDLMRRSHIPLGLISTKHSALTQLRRHIGRYTEGSL